MFKKSIKILTAIAVVGSFAAQVQAATPQAISAADI